MLGFALGVWRVVGKSITGRIGAGLLVVVGLGMFSEGFLRLDCRGIDAACENDSWHSDRARDRVGHHRRWGSTSRRSSSPSRSGGSPSGGRSGSGRSRRFRPTLAGGIVGSIFGNGAASRGGAIVWFAWVALAAAWMLRVAKDA